MKTQELAERIVQQFNMPRAEKYNLSLREFDNMIEVIGLVDDPNCDGYEYSQLKLAIPKCWVTLGVIPANAKVKEI
ncbi:hypothetical protein M0R04_05225 [Candidatus Dojkabacteria bacterium]|jgi:hypothetical protein|nr:hypothetical protein [Candidatus Dojkabacteria bacterium]